LKAKKYLAGIDLLITDCQRFGVKQAVIEAIGSRDVV